MSTPRIYVDNDIELTYVRPFVLVSIKQILIFRLTDTLRLTFEVYRNTFIASRALNDAKCQNVNNLHLVLVDKSVNHQ